MSHILEFLTLERLWHEGGQTSSCTRRLSSLTTHCNVVRSLSLAAAWRMSLVQATTHPPVAPPTYECLCLVALQVTDEVPADIVRQLGGIRKRGEGGVGEREGDGGEGEEEGGKEGGTDTRARKNRGVEETG